MTSTLEHPPSAERTLSDIVEEVTPVLAAHAATHDREGTFVAESYDALRSAGFFAAGVPREFGGLGAGLRELAFAHHDLARSCSSTSLAASMHTHSVATLAWRCRRGAPVGPTLSRVANEGLIMISTGGADHVRPAAVARRVEGGWSVSGRKFFASQAPAGTVLATWAVTEEETPEIIGLSIPMTAPGVEVLDTWDSHGMRGTGSHDIQLSEVFVADVQVGARRPLGRLNPLIQVALINGLSIITGVYLGVADAARQEARRAAAASRSQDLVRQRLVGQVEYEYAAARLAFEGMLARIGDDPESTSENFLSVLHAKRAVADHGARAIDAAMNAVGGQSFYRSSPLERLSRDFRAINYHPLPPESTLFYAGRVALGGDPEEV